MDRNEKPHSMNSPAGNPRPLPGGLRALVGREGVALILVLWVLTLLSVMATQFAYSMRGEAEVTRNFREETEAYYQAKAGIHLAIREIMQDPDVDTEDPSGKLTFYKIPPAGTGEDGKPVRPHAPNRTGIPVGVDGIGKVDYTIEDENGKLNLNGLDDQQTRLLLKKCGGMEEGAELDELANSIMDWKDPDTNHRAGGAENSYYESLNPPYRSKDADFNTLQELLLVKGMTREIYDRISPFLTVYKTQSVNRNTASPCALEVTGTPEKDVEEIQKAVLEKGYFTQDRSSFFTIRSKGYLEGEGISREIVAVVEKDGTGGTQKIRIHYWNDNHFDPSRALQVFFGSSGDRPGTESDS